MTNRARDEIDNLVDLSLERSIRRGEYHPPTRHRLELVPPLEPRPGLLGRLADLATALTRPLRKD